MQNRVRFRGAKCAPLVWLDGSPLGAGEFDLDALSPMSIEAMEVYSGTGNAPPQYRVNSAIAPACGTILIWSREGPKAAPKRNTSAAAALARMVENKQIFTSNEVDVAAREDSGRAVRPVYPDALHEGGVSGTVLAEFVVEESTGVVTDAVGGGNVLILGNDRAGLLTTAEAAVAAIGEVPDVITPFPGGIVRSGSKVGSKYKGMIASTNDAFCPTLRGRVKSELGPDTVAVLEIVIDGLTSAAVAAAMKAALKTIIATGAAKGVTRVSAGNYGGKLGQHHYHLRELLP